MMQPDADAAAVRIPPPLVYLAAVVLGVLLNLSGARFVLALPGPVRVAAASVAGAFGVLLGVTALGVFSRTGQNPKPWKVTPELISRGVYRLTRNPMYVGLALLQAAVGIGLANGWIVVFVPAALWIVYRIAVRHEEAYLLSKFGDAYADYCRSVRRWV